MEEDDFSFKDFKITNKEDEDMDKETCPLITASKSEVKEWFTPWRKALVIKLIGKNLGLHIIIEQAK